MNLSAIFKSDGILSTREQALVTFAVCVALKNEEGVTKLRATAADLKIPPRLLDQVEGAVELVRNQANEGLSMDEALVESSCCGG